MNAVNQIYEAFFDFFLIDTPDFDELKKSVKKNNNRKRKSKSNFVKKEKKEIKLGQNSWKDLHYIILIKLVDFADKF